MADRVRRTLCAWSLADRISATRPTLVTCTLVVRRSASSLRHSPPRHADCAAERVKRRLSFAPFAPRSRTTTPKGKAPGARTTTKQQQSPDQKSSMTTKPPTTLHKRGRKDDHHTHKTQTWRPVSPYIPQVPTPRSSPFSAPPPFQLLREASRKGACPLVPLPARRAGGERNHSWPRSKEIFPPKSGPHSTSPLTFDLHRPSPPPTRGENRRE